MVDFTTTFYNDWQAISIGVAAISVLGSVAVIMLSRLFSLRQLEQVAKTEFVYAASTVLIVIMAVGIITLAEPRLGGGTVSLSKSLYLLSFGYDCSDEQSLHYSELCKVQYKQETLVDWMKFYMETPTKCVSDFMSILYTFEVPVGLMTSVYMEIFMSEHASGFGLKWVEERILNATSSMAFYMYIFYLLAHALNFIKYYSGFFFSIGVALRAFPPTRGAGAYLMAISFGLYFVLPLSYIIIATFGLPHTQSNILTFVPDDEGNPSYICALPPVPDIKDYGCGAADTGRISEMMDELDSRRDELNTLFSLQLYDFDRNIAYSVCFFPMIAFVVLLTFVLNTTNLFGGNIPEIGRGLVKLI